MPKELATTSRPATVPHLGPEARLALDVALGVTGATVGAAVVVTRAVWRGTTPLRELMWRPPLVPRRFHPATVVADLARTGGAERVELRRRAEVLLDALVPAVVAMLLERVDLTDLVEDHVDLDRLVSGVDLDAAVAQVDLDAAVARVDIEAVLDRVDLDAVARRLDVDAVVARADLDAVLDRVDLDAVAAKLDVDAVVARANLDAVIDRIDVIGMVEEVLDVIDLPAIIRDSTGSMASETVRGVRMSGVSADEALTRVVDRALFRRRRTHELPEGNP